MLHRWNMYVNQGERRIPSLIQSGEIELPCINPDVDSYRHQYSPEPLWLYLQIESDLSYDGLYLSLVCAERPTYDGKQWFLRTAYSPSSGGMQQELIREVSWNNVKGIQFWNASFRDYARITQARGLIDYTVYVSRAFGYCFLVGLRFGEDGDDSREDFTNFYPSIHHYHQQVAFNELETYQPFNNSHNWFPRVYGQGEDDVILAEEGAPSLAETADRLSETMDNWAGVVEGTVLGDLLLDTDTEEED